MNIQVEKSHYDFDKYVGKMRWMSYYYQIYEVLKIKGKNILVVGCGDNIVCDILKNQGKNVDTLDFDSELNPDICGSVVELDKLIKKKYDAILCCQVLEHIPFENFESIMNKMSKYSKEKVILSLPSRDLAITFKIRVPYFGEKSILIPIHRFWEKNYSINKEGFGEHYWELKTKITKTKDIEKILKKYFTIENKYIVIENTYHVFYILNV